MVSVGDRIRLAVNKGVAREGVVTRVTGSMLRVRWASDEETTVIPGPGTLAVLGRSVKARPGRQTTAAAARGASGTKAGRAKTASTKEAGASKGRSSKKQPQPKQSGAGRT